MPRVRLYEVTWLAHDKDRILMILVVHGSTIAIGEAHVPALLTRAASNAISEVRAIIVVVAIESRVRWTVTKYHHAGLPRVHAPIVGTVVDSSLIIIHHEVMRSTARVRNPLLLRLLLTVAANEVTGGAMKRVLAILLRLVSLNRQRLILWLHPSGRDFYRIFGRFRQIRVYVMDCALHSSECASGN